MLIYVQHIITAHDTAVLLNLFELLALEYNPTSIAQRMNIHVKTKPR